MRLTTWAWRNLARNRRRTGITILSVAFGVVLAVTFIGSADYSYTSMINTSAVMGPGHLTVQHPAYQDSPNPEHRLAGAEAIRAASLGLPGVVAARARILGQAMFASGNKSSGGGFVAIDPHEEEPGHNLFLRTIVQGRPFADSESREVVVGERLAERLSIGLGKKLVFTVTDANGELVSEMARVCGIFRTGDEAADGGLALLPIGLVRQALGYGPEDASLVAVFLADHRRADPLRGALARLLPTPNAASVLTWQESQADLAGLIAVDRLFNYLLQLLVGLVIAAGVMNTLLMSVMERRREFGIMLAIGMGPGQLAWLVLLESCWIGLGGLLCGALLSTPWVLYMQRVGIDLSRFIGTDYSAGGVLVDPVLRFAIHPPHMLGIGAVALGLTLLAALFPAFRAGRTPPMGSLRR
ncbi:MAG: ABC transporter permease [Thermodesulfobacteriota bacterium]